MVIGTPTVLNLIPGGVMKVIHVNQVNENIEIQFRIMNGAQPFNVPEGVSCTIRGTKGDNFGYAAAVAVTAGSNIVTVTLTEQLTAVAGAGNIFELVFVGASDDMKVSTENFLLDVERAALGEDTVISDSDLAYADQVLDQLQSVGAVNAQVQQNKTNIAAEITRATAAEQTLQQNINAEAAARQAADNTLQSNINAEASSRATTDASLQSQINQLVAPSGSAPSAAEVENARIGSDGTVYPTLGDAIRTQNSLLKSHLDATNGKVLTLYNTSTVAMYTYTDNYAVATSGRVHSHSGARVAKYPVTAGQTYYMHLSKDYSNEAVYQFMDRTANPIWDDTGRIGSPCLDSVEAFITVPEGAIYIFVTENQSNQTNRIYKLDSNKLDELDDKADKTDVDDLSFLLNTVDAEVLDIGEACTPLSVLPGYRVHLDGDLTASQLDLTVYKYNVEAFAGKLLYIDALADLEDNCTVSFRINQGSSAEAAIKLIPKGLKQIYAVPTEAKYVFFSVPSATTVSVNEVFYDTPEASLPDGAVTYPKLDANLQNKIDQIGAITTETGVGLFHAETDTASLGEELLDGTGWSGTGWSGDFANGFTPSANADPLTRAISGLVPGDLYRFTITTSNARLDGYSDFFVSLGGSATFQTYAGGGSSISYVYGLVAGSSDSNLTITPLSGYTGTISGMSLKKVSNAQTPAILINDTDGNPTAQVLTGKDDLKSIYLGLQSGIKAFFASANTAVGVNALKSVTDGFWNAALGMNALADCIHGSRNVAIGYIALQHCVTGDRNIAIGSFALNGLTSGRGNIAIGADASQGNNNNYGIGIGIGANGGGDENIGIGRRAAHSSGPKNVVVGSFAMEQSSTGGFNVALGYQSAQKSTGSYNVNVGAMAGKNSTSGNNNIIIGYDAQKPSATDSNTIVIGGSNHNQVVIAGKVINFNQDGTMTWSALT